MLFYILKIIIISLILILILHNLYICLINTLTVPKIKDLIDTPNKKYQEIFEKINNDINNSNEIGENYNQNCNENYNNNENYNENYNNNENYNENYNNNENYNGNYNENFNNNQNENLEKYNTSDMTPIWTSSDMKNELINFINNNE
jgi:cobalamin biosynthesis protein CobT